MRTLAIGLFPALFLVVSCVETIVMDPGTEDLPVVVNCLLRGSTPSAMWTTGYPQHVDLFYAKGKTGGGYVPVENADVYLASVGGEIVARFVHSSGTRWDVNPIPILLPGTTYTLCVEIPGRDKITASTTIPADFNLAAIWGMMYLYEPDNSMGGSPDFSRSPVSPHHLWIFAHKGGPHVEGETDEDLYEYLVTDNSYADDFNVSGLKFSDLDFSGTPGQVYAEYWKQHRRRQTWKPDLPLHLGFVRIDLPANYVNPKTEWEKEEFGSNENQFIMVCGPQECPMEDDLLSPPRVDHFDVYSVCDDYDQYLRDVYTRKGKIGHDLTALYSTANVYSNVRNGQGIVGSYMIKTNPIIR